MATQKLYSLLPYSLYRKLDIKGGDTVAILSAGLPNLTGELQVDRMGLLTTNPGQAYTRGVFSVGSTRHLSNQIYGGAYGEYSPAEILFNAANSNSIYGASTTVQQAALQLIPQIKY